MGQASSALYSDEDALRAALTEPWSNGQVEGQVNRLKVIKREMYGRAGLRSFAAEYSRMFDANSVLNGHALVIHTKLGRTYSSTPMHNIGTRPRRHSSSETLANLQNRPD